MPPGPPVGQHHRPDISDWPAARTTLDLLDGKWVVAVLAALVAGPSRPKDLLERIGHGLVEKVLTDTLRKMRAQGLVTRHVLDDSERAVIYTLTPQAYTLATPVSGLIAWARAHTD